MKLRPTKSLLGFAAVLLLSLAPAALAGGAVGWLPCLTVLCCALLSLLHLLLVRNCLQCRAGPERTMLTRGEEIPFTARLRNGSFLPVPHLSVQFFLSGAGGRDEHIYPLCLTLSPREERTFSLTAGFDHIGVYQTGLRRLVVTGLFGLFRAESRAEDLCPLSILPRLLELDRLPLSRRQTAEDDRARTPAPLSGMDYVGVREYAYGDPIKTIQWKLSAHAGALMTKQMERYTHAGAAVVLDFSMPDSGREWMLRAADGVAEAGAAVGHWAAVNGMDCLLILPGEDGRIRQNTPGSFRDLQAWLPDMHPMPPDSGGRLAQALREAGSCGQDNVILCAADLTEETVAALAALKQNRKHPMLCLLFPDGGDGARRRLLLERVSRLQSAGIPCRMGEDAREVTA